MQTTADKDKDEFQVLEQSVRTAGVFEPKMRKFIMALYQDEQQALQDYADFIATIGQQEKNFALRWAAQLNNLRLVKAFYHLGANIRYDDNVCIRSGSDHANIEMIKFAHEHGGDLTDRNFFVAWNAAWKNKPTVLQYVLANLSPEQIKKMVVDFMPQWPNPSKTIYFLAPVLSLSFIVKYPIQSQIFWQNLPDEIKTAEMQEKIQGRFRVALLRDAHLSKRHLSCNVTGG